MLLQLVLHCMLQRGGALVDDGVGLRGVVALVPAGVDRIRHPLLAGAAKVIDQQVAGQGGDPGMEAALGGVEAAQVGVELDEDVLGQIFRVMGGSGEAVAQRVDPALLATTNSVQAPASPSRQRLTSAGQSVSAAFGPPFRRPLPARAPRAFRRRVRRGSQRGRSSASRISPPGIGLKALTSCSHYPVIQRERGGQTHGC